MSTMTQENRRLALDFYDAFNNRDLERMRELVSDDFVDHENDPGMGFPEGVDGLMAWAQAIFAGMPDVRLDALQTTCEDDRVVVHTNLTGTHTGVLFGMPPTHRSVDVDSVDIVRVENGRAAEHWGVTDNMRMMEQLGFAPKARELAAVQEVYEAFGRADMDAILDHMTDDVELEPGMVDHGVAWLHPDKGKPAVAEFLRRVGEDLEFTRFEPRAMLATGGQVAAVVDIDATVRPTGREIHDTEIHLWTVDDDGMITSVRHFADTVQHVEAAGV